MPSRPIAQMHPGVHLLAVRTIDDAVVAEARHTVTGAQDDTDAAG